MADKLRLVLDTLDRNFRFTQWPKTAVLDPFREAALIVDRFFEQKATIDADRNLTREGKVAARAQAGKTAMEAINKWHAPRVAGLDADLAQHRTALLPTGEKPNARKIDFMLGLLQKHAPEEVSVFYSSATDDERVVMEAAAASVGRVPMKTANGLVWSPLLNPESVNDSVIARATAKNPAGAQKLRELEEIKSMHVTVAGIATAEVREALREG
jgi:hypothetical protein